MKKILVLVLALMLVFALVAGLSNFDFGTNDLPIGGNSTNDKPTDGNTPGDNPAGGTEPENPPVGGNEPEDPPAGGNEPEDPPAGGSDPDIPDDLIKTTLKILPEHIEAHEYFEDVSIKLEGDMDKKLTASDFTYNKMTDTYDTVVEGNTNIVFEPYDVSVENVQIYVTVGDTTTYYNCYNNGLRPSVTANGEDIYFLIPYNGHEIFVSDALYQKLINIVGEDGACPFTLTDGNGNTVCEWMYIGECDEYEGYYGFVGGPLDLDGDYVELFMNWGNEYGLINVTSLGKTAVEGSAGEFTYTLTGHAIYLSLNEPALVLNESARECINNVGPPSVDQVTISVNGGDRLTHLVLEAEWYGFYKYELSKNDSVYIKNNHGNIIIYVTVLESEIHISAIECECSYVLKTGEEVTIVVA